MSASNATVWVRLAVYSTLVERRHRMLCLRTSDLSVARWNRHGSPSGGRVAQVRRQQTLAGHLCILVNDQTNKQVFLARLWAPRVGYRRNHFTGGGDKFYTGEEILWDTLGKGDRRTNEQTDGTTSLRKAPALLRMLNKPFSVRYTRCPQKVKILFDCYNIFEMRKSISFISVK